MSPQRSGLAILLPLCLIGCIGVKSTGKIPLPAQRLTVTGFSTPESALHDPVADVYLVSNINGSPFGEDRAGFISRVTPGGQIEKLKWIDGSGPDVELNAPKGLALSGDVLYVADVNVVRKFDRTSGEPLGTITIEGVSFLNDLAVSALGEIYVSDTGLGAGFKPTGTDAIYKIDPFDEVTTVRRNVDLAQPNGLLVEGADLLVVTWATGQVLRIRGDGAPVQLVKLATQLDGIVRTRSGQHLVSSWESSSIHAIDLATSKVSVHTAEMKEPADLGYDSMRGGILLPLFNENTLEIIPAE